jgi:hypothetical protein
MDHTFFDEPPSKDGAFDNWFHWSDTDNIFDLQAQVAKWIQVVKRMTLGKRHLVDTRPFPSHSKLQICHIFF